MKVTLITIFRLDDGRKNKSSFTMHTAAEFHLARLHIASLLSRRYVCVFDRDPLAKHQAAEQ